MLDTREKLKDCLKKEKEFYITRKSRHDQMVEWVVKDPCVRIWQYQKVLRYTEYYYCQKGLKKLILYPLYRRRRNRLGYFSSTKNRQQSGYRSWRQNNRKY